VKIFNALILFLVWTTASFAANAGTRVDSDLSVKGTVYLSDNSPLTSSYDLLRNKGNFVLGTPYSAGDVVQSGGSSYVCKTANQGQQLTNDGTYWAVLATQGSTGASPWILNGANAYYSVGKVGIGTTTPNSTLEVSGDFIRSIGRAYGKDVVAQITTSSLWQTISGSRSITYTKQTADTALRITYTDNRYFQSNASSIGNAIVYELIIDGSSCPSGELNSVIPTNQSSMGSDSSTQIKSCFGLSAGSHTINVRVKNTNGTGILTANFGVPNGYWAIEVEEVR